MQKLSAQDEDEGKKYVRMGAVIWLLGVILVVVGAVISAGSITAGTATGLGAGGAISLIGSLIATLGFLIAVYGLLKWLDIL